VVGRQVWGDGWAPLGQQISNILPGRTGTRRNAAGGRAARVSSRRIVARRASANRGGSRREGPDVVTHAAGLPDTPGQKRGEGS